MAKIFNAREITRQLNIVLDKDFGATAFAILRNLIAGSPVGNPDAWINPPPPGYVGGHFRRNWQVTIGGFSDTELEGEDLTGASTLATGKSIIDGFVLGGGGANLVIQNNVPYANRLAQGWSRQAKAGWVDRQIDAALPFPGGTKVVP